MQQLFSEDQLFGKKIKRVEEIDNYFFIFFDDETFCVFWSPNSLNVQISIMKEPYKYPYSGEIAKKMVKYGVYSQEEYDKSENVLFRLRDEINKNKAREAQLKIEEEKYREINANKVTTCCGSKNHFLFQGNSYCYECNSYCELE